MKFMEQEKKGYNADHAYTMIEAVNLSPPLGSKARKIYGATQSYKFNRDIIVPRGFNIDNPGLDAVSGLVEATTNIPLNNTIAERSSPVFDEEYANSWGNRFAIGVDNTQASLFKGLDLIADITESEGLKNYAQEGIIKNQQEAALSSASPSNVLWQLFHSSRS